MDHFSSSCQLSDIVFILVIYGSIFPLIYAALKPLTFHHTAHSILSNSSDMHVHTCISMWYDIHKGVL